MQIDEQTSLIDRSEEKGDDILAQLVPFLGSMMALSTAYIFNYSMDYFTQEFHDTLGWSEEIDKWFEVTLVVFMCFAYLPGVVIPKLGPRMALWIAASINLIGFSFCYIATSTSGLAGTVMAFIGVAFIGQNVIWVTMVSLAVVAANTKTGLSLGFAFGVLQSMIPFGPIIFQLIIYLAFDNDFTGLVMFVTGLIMSLIVVCMSPIVTFLSKEEGKLNLEPTLVWRSMVLVCVVLFSVLIGYDASSSGTEIGTVLALFVVMFYSVLLIVSLYLVLTKKSSSSPGRGGFMSFFEFEKKEEEHDESGPAAESKDKSTTFTDALSQPRFWVVYVFWGVLYGIGNSFYFALDSMVKSGLDNEDDDSVFERASVKSFVALNIGSALARLLAGFGSHIIREHAHWWLLGGLIVASGGLFWLSFMDLGEPSTTIGPIAIVGACFGISFTLVPTIEVIWFGKKDFVKIHAFMVSGCIVGIFVMYIGILDSLYQDTKDENGSEYDCDDCFKAAFQVQALFSLIMAVAGGLVLNFST